MTKPQIWVAAFLVLFILLFLLQRLTNEPGTEEKSQMNSPVTQQDMSSNKDMTPAELVGRLGCTNCHGADLAGTNRAPSLKNVKQYWSKDQLVNYFRNPSSYMSSDRFQEYQKKYPDMVMPSFNNIDVKELGRVAEYLLSQ